jgi:hypothetical protein
MDVIDKHRELVMCVSAGHSELPYEIVMRLADEQGREIEELSLADLLLKIKQHGKITPQIFFPKFGKRKLRAVTPGLLELADAVRDSLLLFR